VLGGVVVEREQHVDFGEIGLIGGRPRTATVTATTPARLLRIDGDAFLDALSQLSPSSVLLQVAAWRLGRSHPTQAVTFGPPA